MLEINFHRNDLVKAPPLKITVNLENYLAALTETGELILYSFDTSSKPKLNLIFSKTFPNAIRQSCKMRIFVQNDRNLF